MLSEWQPLISKLIAAASRDSKRASILRTYRSCEIFYPSVGSDKRTSSVFVLYKKFLNLEESYHRRLDHKNSEIVAGLISFPNYSLLRLNCDFVYSDSTIIYVRKKFCVVFLLDRDRFLFSIQKLNYYDFGFYGNMYKFSKKGKVLIL